MTQQESDLPSELSAPARRALVGAGYLRLEQLSKVSETELKQLHGMGPPSPSTMPAPDEWMRRLGRLPLMHQPGEQWMYNTGSDVLGVLIARASGQPLETF